MQKLLTFFSAKNQHICVSLDVNFNESLTNDVVSFEQLGHGCQNYAHGFSDTDKHFFQAMFMVL